MFQRILSRVILALPFLMLPLVVTGDEITLKNGNKIRGTIKEVNREHIVISRKKGAIQTRLQINQIEPSEVIRLWETFEKLSTAEEQLFAGKFALNNHLFGEARHFFQKIISSAENDKLIAEAKKKLKETKQKEQTTLFQRAIQMKKLEEYEKAINLLEKLQKAYPDSNEAEKASDELKQLAKQLQQKSQNEQKEKNQKKQKVFKKHIDEVSNWIQQAKDNISKGLKREAQNKLPGALKMYQNTRDTLLQARGRLNELQKQNPGKPFQTKTEKLQKKNRKWIIRTYIQIASLHGVQGRVRQGLKYANLALAEDPTSTQAQELKWMFTKHLLFRSSLRNLPY